VDYLNPETLVANGVTIYEKDSLGNFIYGTERLAADQRLGVRALVDAGKNDPHVVRLAAFMRMITVFHDPDLWALRTQGSSTSDDRHLHSRGLNAITMLRKWYQERPHRFRYQFVVSGLMAAFPRAVHDVDFAEAGQTLAMQIYAPGRENPSPLAGEANGLLQMLVLLCNIANGDANGVVAIDEPENCLHPFAIRCFLRLARAFTARHGITLILTTHSPALLDELGPYLESIFVMRSGDHVLPKPITAVRDTTWLENFRLGNVYTDGEIGSNDDPAS
jgi:predicted ATPase